MENYESRQKISLNRVFYHIIFWITYLTLNSLIGSHFNHVSFYRAFRGEAVVILVKILLIYFVFYYLIPLYKSRDKVWRMILSILASFIITTLIYRALQLYVFFNIFEPSYNYPFFLVTGFYLIAFDIFVSIAAFTPIKLIRLHFINLEIEQQILREKLKQSEVRHLIELDALKTRLYTNITHEFRTPLTIILGLVEQFKPQASGSFKAGLVMIHRNGQRVLRLVNQMLELTKAEAGHLELELVQGDIINYLRCLLEGFHPFANWEKIQLQFQSDLKKLIMDYDPERLQTVVSNLLSNAIKFTPGGGTVILQVKQIIEIATSRLEIKVTDTGSGIPEENLPNIFDRFYQVSNSTIRNSEGTGIGLALTCELVKLMKGNIAATNNPGKGATFIVTLPITQISPIAKKEPVGLFSELHSFK